MPEFILPGRDEPAFQNLDLFTQGYIEALFFTDSAPGGTVAQWQAPGFEPVEGSFPGECTVDNLAPETLAKCVSDCATFQHKALPLLNEAYEERGYTEEQAGRDFWFTRNGHGSGFWDRSELDEGDLGNRLSAVAKAFGTRDSYMGDDGKIYLYGG